MTPFRARNYPLVIFSILSLATNVHCDGHAHPADESPPPVAPAAFGYPGFGFPAFGGGAGFSKKLELNAGGGLGWPFPPIGAYPGAIGGPVPEGLPIGDIDPAAAFGGYPPFGAGFVGPSYIPQTWLGSALSAKGDLLFPIVIFIFFVVGVWTVIQFLLALVVPIIAGKFGVEKAVAGSIIDHKLHGRSLSEEDKRNENLNNIMKAVAKSMQKFGVDCNYHFACSMGNSAYNSKNGETAGDMLKQLDKSQIEGNDPKLISIFQEAAKTGDVNCNEKYPCSSTSQLANATNSKSNARTGL